MEEEYFKFRCCMCPNVRSPAIRVCPGIINSLHSNDSPCRFVKIYEDNRGWQYFVRGGIGVSHFKVFYRKPGKPDNGHGYKTLPWRDNFDEAQTDLNTLARKKGWISC